MTLVNANIRSRENNFYYHKECSRFLVTQIFLLKVISRFVFTFLLNYARKQIVDVTCTLLLIVWGVI